MLIIFIVSGSFAMYRNWSNKEENNKIKEVEYSILKSNEKYSIIVPNYFTETDKLNLEASMQYMDLEKSIYFMVIDELKSNTIFDYDEYYEQMTKRFQSNLTKIEIIETKDVTINSLPSKYRLLKGKMHGRMMYIKSYLIDGIATFYQLTSWTSIPNNEYFNRDIDKVVYSFEEITKPNTLE